VRAVQTETGDARGGRMDLPRGFRRTHRMHSTPVHHIRHEILVARTVVPRVDIHRPIRFYVEHSKISLHEEVDVVGSL